MKCAASTAIATVRIHSGRMCSRNIHDVCDPDTFRTYVVGIHSGRMCYGLIQDVFRIHSWAMHCDRIDSGRMWSGYIQDVYVPDTFMSHVLCSHTFRTCGQDVCAPDTLMAYVLCWGYTQSVSNVLRIY